MCVCSEGSALFHIRVLSVVFTDRKFEMNLVLDRYILSCGLVCYDVVWGCLFRHNLLVNCLDSFSSCFTQLPWTNEISEMTTFNGDVPNISLCIFCP